MFFEESDIQFDKLDWKNFEELCFDLLLKYQFHSLNWRQGAGDKGRDIEATFSLSNGLINAYSERWFIECKHYKGGIPVKEVSTKIDWAKAEGVQHFLLITSSYPTQDTLEYFEKRRKDVSFKIHFVDGKMLKGKLLPFPDIIVKYFADDTTNLVKNLIRQWLYHDHTPDVKMLVKLAKSVDPKRLSRDEMIFLVFSLDVSDYDDEFLDPDFDSLLSFDFLMPYIRKEQTSNFPLQEINDNFPNSNIAIYGGMQMKQIKEAGQLFWCRVVIEENGDVVQLFLERQNNQLRSSVASIGRDY